MRAALLFILMALVTVKSFSQNPYYFPPTTGTVWDTVSPASLGWCTDKLDSVIDFVGQKNSKAFIILYKGKIATEKYYGTFTKDSVWYWASAGKSLVSFLTGVAQQEGLLNIQDTTSKYLGTGWTNETPEQEAKIKLIHQLTMTTGLDYTVPDLDCTADTCLLYHADAGTEWYYHNAPYHLLQDVIASASGVTFSNYTTTHVGTRAGIYGLWYDYIFYSKPRAAARFGLLMLNNGTWNNDAILSDQQYLNASHSTSQNYNLSYGYLWWLNGKSSFMAPTSTITFPGMLCPTAPADMYAALGKNDQKIYVVPSMDLVVVRMGNDAGQAALGPSSFDNDLWEKLMQVFCNTTAINEAAIQSRIKILPNPVADELTIQIPDDLIGEEVIVYNISGQKIISSIANLSSFKIQTTDWTKGVYFVKINSVISRMIKE